MTTENEDLKTETALSQSAVEGIVIATACLRAIPTWFLTNLVTGFLPIEHAWKKKWFGLYDWQRGQTQTCKIFDYVFWIQGLLMANFIIRLWL